MRRITILLLAVLSMSLSAFAQDPTQSQKTTTTSPATSHDERPKTDVDHQIDEARQRGETVLTRCLENCGENAIAEEDVEVGRALELPKPSYPPLARAAHASGQVQVQLLIDEEGKVIAAVAVSGHPLLYGASVGAARNARFAPTKVKGKPVKVTGVIAYNFIPQ